MLALIYALYLAIKKPRMTREKFVSLALVWVLVCLVAISIFPDRKPNYALPLFPMLAWIAAWAICRIPRLDPGEWLARSYRWLVPSLALVFVIVSLAPIQFQQPAEKNWVALIDWIEAEHIDAAQLAHASIDQNDVCYVYLKTGKWMKSLRLARSNLDSKQSELMLVTKFLGKTKPAPQQVIYFQSGPVYVVSNQPEP
jgi:4-amino-4-deoxy-L-arabinose transferase-like glycosyltransferase